VLAKVAILMGKGGRVRMRTTLTAILVALAMPGVVQAQSSQEVRMADMSCAEVPLLGYKVDYPRCIQALRRALVKQDEDYQHRIQMLELQVQTLQSQMRTLQADRK
jgi:hypothetical protein